MRGLEAEKGPTLRYDPSCYWCTDPAHHFVTTAEEAATLSVAQNFSSLTLMHIPTLW